MGVVERFYTDGFIWKKKAEQGIAPDVINLGVRVILNLSDVFVLPSDFLTYTNIKHNYQLRYLNTYQPRRCSEELDLARQDEICIERFERQPKNSWVAISIKINPSNKFGPLECKTELECIKKWKFGFDKRNSEFIDTEKKVGKYTVKGFNIRRSFDNHFSQTSIYFLLKDSKIWFISINDGNIPADQRQKVDQEVDKMLSSFRFID
ncbi:MAG TPA: hypothetical protein VD999_06990 [Vitreimonas sp.]|nr:hypothetical protein [Vitreimonas sp.]